ncbi:hypothetical protein [Pseudodesulfovibrio karagichevae]|uniref:Uncharacterized protein n=1 Tax=Pseudodesulfovibrio karagichevae TaxID=3239305 RepID=A0ABV4K2F5_9BACT
MFDVRTYLRRRALRKQEVDIYAAAKAWSSPHPIHIIKFDKPYLWYSGLCPVYSSDRRNIYVNTASYIHRKATREKTLVRYPGMDAVYEFSQSYINFSLKREKYSQIAVYNYAHECAHKFLSIKYEYYSDHEVQFGIVMAVLIMRLWLSPEPVFTVYNFQEELQACQSFKRCGIKPTLMALRLLVLEAANEINSNYTNVLECCEQAMRYSRIVHSEKLIIKWAGHYKRQKLKKRLKLLAECSLCGVLILLLYMRM